MTLRHVGLKVTAMAAGGVLSVASMVFASGLSLYPGTEAAGMAGAFRGVADDWSAAFWNPAGLVDLPATQVVGTGTFVLPNMNLTPSEYKKMTGHRLGFKNTIALKAAQKALHHKTTSGGSAVIPAILYIVLAIIGLGWLAMGINDSFQGSDWLISLVLYILFYIPGLIYTLIKMGKYY